MITIDPRTIPDDLLAEVLRVIRLTSPAFRCHTQPDGNLLITLPPDPLPVTPTTDPEPAFICDACGRPATHQGFHETRGFSFCCSDPACDLLSNLNLSKPCQTQNP